MSRERHAEVGGPSFVARLFRAPRSQQVQGTREVDLTNTLPYLECLCSEYRERVTVTHLWVAALGRVLRRHPELNVRLRRGRPAERSSVDVYVQVAVTHRGSAELSGLKVRGTDRASVVDIARQVHRQTERIRTRQVPSADPRESLSAVPSMLRPWAVRAASFATQDLGLDLSRFGVSPDPFGSAIVTNVGGFGIPVGMAPLVPMSRVPMLFMLGAIHERPWAVDGEVMAKPTLIASASFDQRLFDGYQIGYLSSELVHMVENPESYRLL